MKKNNKFDLWIDHSIAQFMKLTDGFDPATSGVSASEQKELPKFHPLPPLAEASDYLSMNEWIEARDDSSSMRYEQ